VFLDEPEEGERKLSANLGECGSWCVSCCEGHIKQIPPSIDPVYLWF